MCEHEEVQAVESALSIIQTDAHTRTLAPRDRVASLIPDTDVLTAAYRMAGKLADAGCVPKQLRGKQADVFAVIMHGAACGLQPLQSVQQIAIINGKTSIYGDGIPALLFQHPDLETFVELSPDEITTHGECTIKRKGHAPVVRRFSVDDAKKAHLWGKDGPWSNYPERMLQMRARAWAARDAMPDALMGLYCYEEAVDLNVAPKVLSPGPPIDRDEGVWCPACTARTLVEGQKMCDACLSNIQSANTADEEEPTEPEPAPETSPEPTTGERMATAKQLDAIRDKWDGAVTADPYGVCSTPMKRDSEMLHVLRRYLEVPLLKGMGSITNALVQVIFDQGDLWFFYEQQKRNKIAKYIIQYSDVRDTQRKAFAVAVEAKDEKAQKALGEVPWPDTLEQLAALTCDGLEEPTPLTHVDKSNRDKLWRLILKVEKNIAKANQ